MFFNIPFEYQITFIPKGAHKERTGERIGYENFHIPHIALDDVDLAFEVGHGLEGKMYAPSFSIQTDGRPSRVWASGDQLYSEFCTTAEFEDRCKQSSPLNPLRFSKTISSVATFNPFGERFYAAVVRADSSREAVTSNEGSLRYWEDDEGASVIPTIRTRLQDFVIIDGYVCISVTEPVIIVSPVGGRGNEESVGDVTISIGESMPGGASGRCFAEAIRHLPLARTFRLDELEQAREWARVLASCEFSDVSRKIIEGTVIQTVARNLRHSSEYTGIEALVKYANSLRRHVGEMPTDVAMAWYGLRDVSTAAFGVPTNEVIVAIEQLVVRIQIADAAGGFDATTARTRTHQRHNKPHAGEKVVSIDDASARIRAFAMAGALEMERWDNRPNDGREWVDGSIKNLGFKDRETSVTPLLTAESILSLSRHLGLDNGAEVAAAAAEHTHYPFSVRGSHGAALAVASRFGDTLTFDEVRGYGGCDMDIYYGNVLEGLAARHLAYADDEDALGLDMAP